MRQIVLDTETTGMDPKTGHRLVEIGCVEVEYRRLTGNNLHLYINPEREVDAGAAEVHGLTWEKLKNEPTFKEVAQQFVDYIGDAELIIHNAPFDLGFLNTELAAVVPNFTPLEQRHSVIDTLIMARDEFPGQRNSLDALCKRFEIDNSARELHGALLDSELLADVYLAMTGGQIDIGLLSDAASRASRGLLKSPTELIAAAQKRPRVFELSAEQQQAHRDYLGFVAKSSGDDCAWTAMENASETA